MNEPRFIEIEVLKPDYLEAFNRLISQLSTSSHTLTEAELNSLIASPQSHLYALEYDEKIIGMVTLCIYQCPTGRKAWITRIYGANAIEAIYLLIKNPCNPCLKLQRATLFVSKNSATKRNGIFEHIVIFCE